MSEIIEKKVIIQKLDELIQFSVKQENEASTPISKLLNAKIGGLFKDLKIWILENE